MLQPVRGQERDGRAQSEAVLDRDVTAQGPGRRCCEEHTDEEEERASMPLNDWFASREERARARAEARLRAHPWPTALLEVLARLREGSRYALLVGGSVRDVLLGREATGAFDVATDLRPAEVRERFAEVEPIGEALGTLLVRHAGVDVECTTFRREGEYSDARHPDAVWFTRDPLDDLDRRDLTVNAMAFDPATGRLLDPHDGALDLARRRLRAVGDAEARFREDALRPLRVARFAATLEFEVEDATRRALGSSLDRSARVAVERVRVEFERLMTAREPSIGFELLREAGLLALWLPELAACRGVPQNRFHAHDVYFHLLYSADCARPDDPVVRWAALLHDIGKPATRVEKVDGDGTFYNHEVVGASIADTLLRRLRASNGFREQVVHLVREHMFDYRPSWSDAALRRWLRRVGVEHVAQLFDLRIADCLGNGRKGFPQYLDAMAQRIDALLARSRALDVADLAVDGRDVMRALDLPPGPAVGRVLEGLLEDVLEDPACNTRDMLLERLAARRRAQGDVA